MIYRGYLSTQCVALAGSDLLVCMIEYRVWFLGVGSFSEVSCGV